MDIDHLSDVRAIPLGSVQLLFVERHNFATMVDVVAMEPISFGATTVGAGTPVSLSLRDVGPATGPQILDQLEAWGAENDVVDLGVAVMVDRWFLTMRGPGSELVLELPAVR
jgi:hypothetical protein